MTDAGRPQSRRSADVEDVLPVAERSLVPGGWRLVNTFPSDFW